MSIKIAIADDNSFLLKVILEKLSFFKDMEVKLHSYNGWNFCKNWNKIPMSI
jgi:hypothetical protein